MVVKLNHKVLKGLRVRINAAIRCLFRKHYVLVCWKRCDDGEHDYKISHKGAELPETVLRLNVAAEIVQDIDDQNEAVWEIGNILKSK